MLWASIQFFGGLVILIIAGDYLVGAAVKLANYLRVSPMVIGLTIVSLGTSFPELVVSVNAALSGHPDISIGNVVGSNIANLALVLGFTGLISPLKVRRKTLLFDIPVMLLSSGLLIGFALDYEILRWEGTLLLLLLLGYNSWIIREGKRDFEPEESHETPNKTELFRGVIVLILSLAGLIVGADLLVDGAVFIARAAGVEERIIAVTVIAFGTSVPELATSLIAIRKNEIGISLGNLIGSNVFNVLGIIGVTSILSPLSVNVQTLQIDFWWFILIPLILFGVVLYRQAIDRITGIALVLTYLVYILILF